ncbi:MAG: hypothetical protein COS37_00485 [Anaerolineae bacterium CG03_land_8_20_14_0_80_58_20]|nr:MAG: hypothetical protein COS37_00485 [Anaerolineae bacterium CG03_land_8_20_14_0_80_58_20]
MAIPFYFAKRDRKPHFALKFETEKLPMTHNLVQTIDVDSASDHYDHGLFEHISWSQASFSDHRAIATSLQNKRPYTITILIERLKEELRNRKEYVQKTKVPIGSRYKEALYDLFYEEFGQRDANARYAQWLDAYRTVRQKDDASSIDDTILEKELEPRYRQSILARYKNHERLFKDRIRIDRKRYYRLPEPLHWFDWRCPYDNLFIWEENGQKVARRGGSGSSGARETNSMFILGLLDLNKRALVPSFLFVYTEMNELKFLKRFDRLCVPLLDIGANYPACAYQQIEEMEQGEYFMKWDLWDLKHVEIIQYS